MPALSTTGTEPVQGAAEARLPLLDQGLYVVFRRVVLGVYHHTRRAVVGETGPVAHQSVAAHVEREAHGGDRGQPRVLVERIEVAQPHDLVHCVRDLLA